MTPIKRGLAAATLPLLLGLSLTACGGGASSAPDDASKGDFCQGLQDIDSEGDDADAAHKIADQLQDVGTPKEIDGDAREGFEIFVDFLADVDDDDIKKLDDAEGPEDVFDGDDGDKVTAFLTQAGQVCIDELAPDTGE